MDIAPWMAWFLGCRGRAIDPAQVALGGVLKKARFRERIRNVPLSGSPRRRAKHELFAGCLSGREKAISPFTGIIL